eukprot:scaffold840_cov265-Pinguiococcus_pyrenoidosus.AAC.12
MKTPNDCGPLNLQLLVGHTSLEARLRFATVFSWDTAPLALKHVLPIGRRLAATRDREWTDTDVCGIS